MKTGRNIIFFLLLITDLNICQNLAGYYPLEIGNTWEYWDPYDSLFLERDVVIGDTIMPNGKTYRVIKTIPGIFPVFLRQDSAKVYRYFDSSISHFPFPFYIEDEILYYDFNKTAGDTLWIKNFDSSWVENLDCAAIYGVTFDYEAYLFGKIRRHQEYHYRMSSLDCYTYYYIHLLVDSIGLVYRISEAGNEYFLRGAIINGLQYGTITNLDDKKIPPENFMLYQNYPNPFNPSTTISYALMKPGKVTLKVFDVLGREDATLVNEFKSAGHYSIQFDASSLSSGIYFYRLHAGSYVKTKKMIVAK